MSAHEQRSSPTPRIRRSSDANIAVGARLLRVAVVFLFMSFVFAFFYLRALNSNHSFRHGARQAAGRLRASPCSSACSARRSPSSRWRAGSLRDGTRRRVAPGRRLAALAARWPPSCVQVIEYFNLSFGAADGGLASVFFGFTAVFGIFWLGAVYWVETLWAQSLRQPGERRR